MKTDRSGWAGNFLLLKFAYSALASFRTGVSGSASGPWPSSVVPPSAMDVKPHSPDKSTGYRQLLDTTQSFQLCSKTHLTTRQLWLMIAPQFVRGQADFLEVSDDSLRSSVVPVLRRKFDGLPSCSRLISSQWNPDNSKLHRHPAVLPSRGYV